MTARRRLRIYIAGPYTAVTPEERMANVDRAIDVGLRLHQRGHFPFIPHLTHFVDQRATHEGVVVTYEEYLEWDEEFLALCDAVFYLAPSRGADRELSRAKKLGMIIFYDLEEVPDARD